MSGIEANMDDFVNLVFKNLSKNGFPEKSVAFPLEKMYEAASQRGFSFNKVRDLLQQQGITTELTEEKVIFSQAPASDNGFDMAAMMSAAQQWLGQMSPEMRSQLELMMQNLGPEDMERIRGQWESMSEEDKARKMEEMKKFTEQS